MQVSPLDWERTAAEAAELLSAYIQINTVNPPGNETEGARFLQDILKRNGIGSEIIESKPGRGSLVSGCTAGAVPEIMLLHHIDVVQAEAGRWQVEPFSGCVRNGELWGRGALDCKGLGIIELMAFLLLKRQGLDPERRIVYAATADEEAGGAWGVPWLLQHHPEKFQTRYVINEGVGWGLRTGSRNVYLCQVAEKGSCWLKITFEGRPGHGSIPHDENCVLHMARAMQVLGNHRFGLQCAAPVRLLMEALAREQEYMRPEQFLGLMDPACSCATFDLIADAPMREMLGALLTNTMVPTVAQAGKKTNVIPSECFCEVDARILPGTTPEELTSLIERLLTDAGCRGFTVELPGGSRASESSMDTELYRVLGDTIEQHDPRGMLLPYLSPGATDSRFFRERGVVAYGMQFDASIESNRLIHGHDERISLRHLLFGIQVLYDTLRRFLV
ncbi:MAG: M20/M25/M40 family metallo-hydrolase [Deltaproteobacteria bacterium]|nr:M20/M25/M40 family metallo-hydrolase [Deltaproteobacteria bacterium]